MLKTEEILDISHTLAKDYLKQFEFPFEAITGIKEFIIELGQKLPPDYIEIKENIWVHKTANIYPSAYIGAPCIIGPDSEIRHCAFIRGSALIGQGCVIGNSVELKNVIIFDSSQVPHFNYVGDSILGYKAHLGAGAITSNVRSDKSSVTIKTETEQINTRLKKFGAIIGDNVEIGCNSVLNPGTIIGRNSRVYPLSCVRGFVAPDSIHKTTGIIIKKEIR